MIVAAAAAALLSVTAAPTVGDARARPPKPDSADRLVFWLGCDQVAALTNAELDRWKGSGVDGFVCMAGHLRDMGGTQDFTGNPHATLQGQNYDLQRTLRDSHIVQRAAARGMKLYLGVKLVNYFNTATPLVDWFDDAGWSHLVLPKMRQAAGAARALGFAGLAFDAELYPQRGGVSTATWSWDYPGNTHSQAAVRAKAEQRGRQLMRSIVAAFPGAQLVAYDVQFPETWSEFVVQVVAGIHHIYADRLDINFWDGLLSVRGYRSVRLLDATFFKSSQIGSWKSGFQYDYNRVSSYLSHKISNWRYASSRLFLSPFSWINPGPNPGPYDDARSPAYVMKQLLAFRRWGMGGEFGNFVYGDLGAFDYSPYRHAMRLASTPATVDRVKPTLTATRRAGARRPRRITGIAHDNLAIWAVRWHDNRGRAGVAKLNWKVLAGDYRSRYVWETRWAIPITDLAPGATRVTVTAEDIKGNRSTPATVSLHRSRARDG